MALIIPPGFAQVVFGFAWPGDSEIMVTTLGVDYTGQTGGADNLATAMFTAWANSLLQQQTNNLQLQEVTAYKGQDGGPPVVEESTNTAANGGANSDPLPPNSALLIRKRTGLAGRRGRGRFYLPGAAEGPIDANGNLGGSYLNAVQAEADAFMTELDNIGVVPVVLHRTEGIGTEPPPTVITSFVADGKIATQRRRLRP